ncbi:3-hydroxylacyl-ACP dehydratase [Polaromonas sp. SM01]|uniref:3-hydroxylacyl-ACP dehydratase n=1 Tax=Polaromonas sp. SM01 TaxID=3085630 RepID=UPI003990461C
MTLMPSHMPATLQHDEIARRIPHQGNMCLLDAVTSWDHSHIQCQANSHNAHYHPLRAYGRLGAACGVEYAAQAMAVHGALVAESLTEGSANIPPRVGYLASMRSVTLHVDRLDTVTGPLTVSAERITGDDNTVLYNFKVQAGAQTLLSGRAVVVLDAAALSPLAPAGAHPA